MNLLLKVAGIVGALITIATGCTAIAGWLSPRYESFTSAAAGALPWAGRAYLVASVVMFVWIGIYRVRRERYETIVIVIACCFVSAVWFALWGGVYAIGGFGLVGLLGVGAFVGGFVTTLAIQTIRASKRKTKRCPDCAEAVQFEARVCRYCGYKFDIGSPDATAKM